MPTWKDKVFTILGLKPVGRIEKIDEQANIKMIWQIVVGCYEGRATGESNGKERTRWSGESLSSEETFKLSPEG